MGNDKRLVKRNEQGEVRYATPCKGNSVQELYEEGREKDKAIMKKLCNLEDKIENGTLIELPFIQKGQYGNRWYVYYRKKTGNKNITWKMYYSKAEAKKKLKELREV